MNLFAASDSINQALLGLQGGGEAIPLEAGRLGTEANPIFTKMAPREVGEGAEAILGSSADSPLYTLLLQGTEDSPLRVDLSARINEIFEHVDAYVGTPNLLGSSEENQLHVKFPDVQKVKVEGGTLDGVKNTVKIQGDVNAKQVGTFAVTQSGQWVIQLAGGQTLPVRVEGGRMTVDIGGGLEGLASDLDAVEAELRSLGGI